MLSHNGIGSTVLHPSLSINIKITGIGLFATIYQRIFTYTTDFRKYWDNNPTLATNHLFHLHVQIFNADFGLQSKHNSIHEGLLF